MYENNFMNHKQLVEKVSANLIRKGRRIESRKSWLTMRNYLHQLSDDQLKSILNEASETL